MPDISPTGKEVLTPNDRMRIRRMELLVEQTRVGILTKEIHVEELELQRDKEIESIDAAKEELARTENELKALVEELETEKEEG